MKGLFITFTIIELVIFIRIGIELYKFMKENLELLQTVFIVSGLEIQENQRSNEEKLGVKIEQAEGKKCERCWMYSKTVGEDQENPTICHKCSKALK